MRLPRLQSGLGLLLLALLAANWRGEGTAAAQFGLALPVAPALPPWAAPLAKTSRARNWYFTLANSTVAAANATGTTLDVAFYGDSLTGLLVTIPANVAVWREFFGEEATGWKAGLMGVAGSTVEELVWRLLVNGERLQNDPRVLVLLIGINNGLDTEPWAKLDWLLGWFAAAYPRTKVLVVAPLPSFRGTSGTLAARYRPVVHRWPGVGWSTCGAGLNWRNASLFTDGLHLTPEGYRIYFSCLKPTVATLLKGAKGGGAAAQAQGSKKGG